MAENSWNYFIKLEIFCYVMLSVLFIVDAWAELAKVGRISTPGGNGQSWQHSIVRIVGAVERLATIDFT